MISTKTYDQAIRTLMASGVGVMPTDTVYGLVARAADKAAVARLYAVKQREGKPGTVIAASVEQLVELGVQKRYLEQVKQWWPGAMSVETPYSNVDNDLDQGTGHCAWRVVADDRLRKVLEQTGPLVTSSANYPGGPGAVTVDMAQNYFSNTVDFYVDGGNLSGRLPSTVIRMAGSSIEIIRKGAVDIDTVENTRSCPFCQTSVALKGQVTQETDMAFMIEAASNPGDYLIIPKAHIEKLDGLPDGWWSEVKALFKQIPNLPANYNVSLNIGKPAGQSVEHLHFWVIPRLEGRPSTGKGLARLIDEIDQA